MENFKWNMNKIHFFSCWCFLKSRVFDFHEIQFIYFLSFVVSAFSVLRNLCFSQCHEDILLYCLFFSFDFIFTSVIHLGISFCIWCEVGSVDSFLPCDTFYITLEALLKINWLYKCGSLPGLSLFFQWSVFHIITTLS